SLMVATLPCLRRPTPPAPLLPALVFPDMSRQTASSTLPPAPASTRIPWRPDPLLVGAETLLPESLRLKKPDAFCPTMRRPFPLVPLTVLFVTFKVRWGVDALLAGPEALVTAIPFELPPTWLAATMLLSMVVVMSA